MSAQHNITLNFIAWLITTDYCRAWLEFSRKFNCDCVLMTIESSLVFKLLCGVEMYMKLWIMITNDVQSYVIWCMMIRVMIIPIITGCFFFNLNSWALPLKDNTVLFLKNHYGDVIMIAMASQTTSLAIVYSIAYSPINGEFPAQRARNAKNISIWGRHHANASPRSDTLWYAF